MEPLIPPAALARPPAAHEAPGAQGDDRHRADVLIADMVEDHGNW